jgi:carbon-monoxide dehydrogenase iron sulfur subunit
MKKVVVHPERCVGCMQCMISCAVAHSQSKTLLAAMETPLPRPRVHVGPGPANEGFPNRCRHCNPAPCMAACLPGAIYRSAEMDTVLVDPDKCINCASCAMACPFGVLSFHEDFMAPPEKVVAIKCDNCVERQSQGLVPACVDVCKAGALTFEEPDQAMKRKTTEVARSVWEATEEPPIGTSAGFNLMKAIKKAQLGL